MLNFCTLFDSAYLVYGLALHSSLERYCSSYHIYIFAFDDKSFEILTEMQLKNVTVISLNDFEDEELLRVKKTRAREEYFWTCASSTTLYVLNKYNVDMCTYLDADIFFFSDPSILIEEIKEKSVLITEHHYTPKYDRTNLSGKYCVQFVAFKNNPDGRRVLMWWRNECIKWCYNKHEDGKFGDQKYLDDWPDKFSGIVHELEHLGGGIAPWNVQQYKIFRRDRKLHLVERKTKREYQVVFFHFHNVRFNPQHFLIVRQIAFSYHIPISVYLLIYKEYIRKMSDIVSDIGSINSGNVSAISFSRVLILIFLARLQNCILQQWATTIGKIKSGIKVLVYGKTP